MKIAYLFNPKTFEPAGSVECQKCQITGEYLVPYHSVPVAPPQYSPCIVLRALNRERWVGDLPASVARALEEVDRQHAEALRKVTGNATPEERDTWAPKVIAARAVVDGAATDSQKAMIGLEAEQRGVPVQALAQRVIANAAEFELVVGKAAAFRAMSRKAIGAAKTVDELDATLKQLMQEVEQATQAATT